MFANIPYLVSRCLLLYTGSAVITCAQDAWTLDRVLREAAAYPSIRAGAERATAAAAAIQLARTAYLPRVDVLAQANRATRNNIFGMVLPQSVIPAISGPPLMSNSLTSVWGSAAGVLFSWEPFDFGLRGATVARAEAEKRRAEATVKRTQLDVAAEAADAFLTALAAQQTVRAAEAAVQRSRTVLEMVDAQVRAELRPGADASRARAELAVARNGAVLARQAIAEAQAALAGYVAPDATALTLVEGRLLDAPLAAMPELASDHPRVAEQQAAVAETVAARNILSRSWYPRFHVQGASYGRGTGAMPDGRTLGGVEGLGPNIHNWGAGLTVTFPVLDYASLRARAEIEDARLRAEQQRLTLVEREIRIASNRALAQFEAARQIAENTPIQLEAAKSGEQQALARYRAGLGTLTDVADAQRLVAQAEIDHSLARLNIWRGLLRLAYARGDLQPFIQAISQ